jgi:deoxycytidine triphosphate deaminase/cell division protein FtsL
MILKRNSIRRLIESEKLIENRESIKDSYSRPPIISPAKMALHLGEKCYLSSKKGVIIKLCKNKTVKIKPNDAFFYQTLEKVKIPNNIAGHAALKMKQSAKGLLMSTQPQIDPGYNNYLFGMFYNLSDNDVELAYGEDILTLELSQVETTGDKIFYEGGLKDKSFEEFFANRVDSSLNKLVSENKRLQANMKLAGGTITIIIMMITLVIGATTIKPIYDSRQLFKELDDRQKDITELEKKFAEQQKEITRLKEKLSKLEPSANSQPSTVSVKSDK